MNFLPNFVAWPFAVAGLAAAAGPIIIHLLNRRRFRTVQWAAMDFLRQALQRNRRILQMRDLLLLLLRTLAVLLIGAALAQPFFSPSQEAYDGTKPLHCVLVIDNSLSMGYESLDGTLLDQAKQRARQLVESLPGDSRVSVIPACGSRWGYSPDSLTKEDALELIEQVEVVDRAASVQRAVNEALKACETGPQLAKRVMLFSDQQSTNWTDLSVEQLGRLPSLQVIDVDGEVKENTWIESLQLQDGVADVETPATILVKLRHDGDSPREHLQVTLTVDDVEVASKTVTLESAAGSREVAFEYTFQSFQPQPGRALSVPITASITPDRLPNDDTRSIVVPVVTALPVVFIDQYGSANENSLKNRLGETRPLRRLLAPVTSRTVVARQLIRLRHITLEQLDQSALEDARLVVIAGIADPGVRVPLLREYVQQGGQLVIAAGGRHDSGVNGGFDPSLWTSAAWMDGQGVLPLPLQPGLLGSDPEMATSEVRPFFLDFDSLASHEYFQLGGVGEDELRSLYSEPFFFQAVRTDLNDDVLRTLEQNELKRLQEELSLLEQLAAAKDADSGVDSAGNGDRTQAVNGESRLQELRPEWLLWGDRSSDLDSIDLQATPDLRERILTDLAAKTVPRVLARFDDPAGTPLLIERKIGSGTVMFVSSGLLPEWNTLATTNAMLIFDRILRGMVRSTLPTRNYAGTDRITLPLPVADRDVQTILQRPGREQTPETLDIGFIGRDQLGVNIEQPLTRGIYLVTARREQEPGDTSAPETLWSVPLAVNGDGLESELHTLTREDFDERVALNNVQWVAADEPISLAGSQIRGQDSWWWLTLAVLGLLLLELLILATNLGYARRVQMAI